MTAVAVEHRSFGARTWSAIVAVWGGFIGLLHHVGPLAGAALAVFAAMFAFSSLVLGPAISGGDTKPPPGVEQPADHGSHHK